MIQNLIIRFNIIVGKLPYLSNLVFRKIICNGAHGHSGRFTCKNPHRHILKHKAVLF